MLFRWALGLAFLITVLFTSIWYEAALTADAPKSHPRQVLLIRHAEKPPEESVSVELTEAGKQRANALHRLFEKSADRPEPFAKPDFIFAGANTNKSERSVLTATPLAASLGVKLSAGFEKADFASLARELLRDPKYAAKTVLVCWNHSNLPGFARSLGADGVPADWKPDVFDRVWVLTWGAKGKVTFKDVPQKLMPGDAAR